MIELLSASYTLLFFAIASLWLFTGNRVWIAAYALSLSFALYSGLVTAIAACPLVSMALCLFLESDPAIDASRRYLLDFFIIIFFIGLKFHLFPGFNNWFAETAKGKLYFNYDTASAGLMLTGALVHRCQSLACWKKAIIGWLLFTPLAIAILAVPALASGFISWHPHWPHAIYSWMLANLLITCIAEESFFRVFLWSRIENLYGIKTAWIATALLFGIAHFAGGWAYVALATIAGLLYGGAYWYSGKRVEAAILTHFTINLVHYTLFI